MFTTTTPTAMKETTLKRKTANREQATNGFVKIAPSLTKKGSSL